MLAEKLLPVSKGGLGPSDPNFKNVTLLLPGDVNQNLTYTAFSDASSNNFLLTPFGDAYGTPFSPYNTSWSNYFDGTGDYLTVPDNTAFAFGSGNFTIEGWVNLSAFTGLDAGGVLACQWLNSSSNLSWLVYFSSTGVPGFLGSTNGTIAGDIAITAGSAITRNTWNHIAVVRNGSTFTLYVNGVSAGTATNAGSLFDSTRPVEIGTFAATRGDTTGYISNLRVVKGVAVYTGNFTPPSLLNLATSGAASANCYPSTTNVNTTFNGTSTSLLTCQSNRFIDNSSNSFTLTRNGNTSISSNSPIADTDTTTGSGYFDGNGDYLRIPDNSAFWIEGDFTIEAWVYPTVLNTYNAILAQWPGASVNSSFTFRYDGSRPYMAWSTTGTNGFGITGTTTTVFANAWNHIAVTRSGSTIRLFVNGVVDATTGTYSGSFYNSSAPVDIGLTDGSNSYNPTGYISNVRMVKGTALYTGNFTPPTSPLTAVSGTSLLTLQTRGAVQNIGFIDSSANRFPITKVGNTTQGTFSPYGNLWSNYFDGSGDYLSVANNAALQFGTNPFTIEMWVYLNTITGTHGFLTKADLTTGWSVVQSGTTLYFEYATSNITSTTTLTTNQWTHIAVVRSGTGTNQTTIYVNGVAAGSGTVSTNFSNTQSVLIGEYRQAGNTFNGYISNLRIVNGTAVYTSNFTPSTTPLTAVSGTSLLTCQSNRFIDNSSNNFTLTVNGNTSVQRFSPFNPTVPYSASTIGGSGYFDGSGDYLTLANNTALDMGSSSFTIEGWFYTNTIAAGFKPIAVRFNGNAIAQTDLQYFIGQSGSTLQLSAYGASVVQISFTSALSVGQWYHFALVRDGNNIYGYLNGVRNATTGTISGALNNGTWTTYLGYYNEGGSIGYFNGYTSNIRVVKGTALYTGSTYTVPTAPLTAVTGTSLLCNFTNAGVWDAAMMNDLESVGNARIVTTVKKYNTGSMYFDGTGDWLLMPANNMMGLTGDFTIECWYNLSVVNSYNMLLGSSGTSPSDYIAVRASNIEIGINATSYPTWTATTSSGTWYHLAVVRQSGTIKVYQNGTALTLASGSASNSTVFLPITQGLLVGKYGGANGGGYPLNGYIDDLRITKGYARYTANFTPPTQALPLY